ncbi:MAG: 50S ribosomal protein L4 [Acidobacteriota bacterium]
MKVEIKNLDNQTVRDLELPEAVFGYPYKEHLIHLAVVAVRAAARAGTHSTKRRSEVQGSGRKLVRQKGTGRARMGSIRSPLWRKGGTVHGPKPRNYEKNLTPREKRNALKSALSRKLADEQIVVLDSLQLESHKTQALDRQLSGLGVPGKALLVDDFNNDKLALAVRNNPRLKAVDAMGVNVYDVVGQEHIVLSEEALGRLVEVLSK